MCEYPAVVCQLMPRIFEVDGALWAQEKSALQAGHGRRSVARGMEVHERNRARTAAAGQQAQSRETRAAVTITLRYARTRTSIPRVLDMTRY